MKNQPEISPLATPEAGELLLAFVNSNAGGRTEHFADAASLLAWARANSFTAKEVTPSEVSDARGLRDALQTLLLDHSGDEEQGESVSREAEENLARLGASHPLISTVTRNGAELATSEEGVAGLLGTIIASVTELSLAGTWPRFKACQNPICHESFYDHSRNGSAIYHAASCSSMVAMRKYRQRKKDQSNP
jgi:predicted RNA-binding Zn ribbon-like protein